MTRAPYGPTFPRPLAAFYLGADPSRDAREGYFDRSEPASLAFPGAGPGVTVSAIFARSRGKLGRFDSLDFDSDGRGHS